MDFSSEVSVFLDPPTWHQQEISDQQTSGVLIQTDPLQIPPPTSGVSTGSGPGSIRPGSMVDRARLAQLPLPEPGLKCPRCESTNTKFCYFNNYNLSQPRHFCKGCRRYWTRGGALRNVPVGGGCRRNKRTKSRAKTGSKTDPGILTQNARRGSMLSSSSVDNNNSTNDLRSQLILPPPHPDPFLPGLGYRYLNGFGSGFGLNLGGGGSGEVEQLSSLLAGSGVTGNGLYPFSESSLPDHTNSLFGRVKVDENHQGLNLPKNLMLNDQFSNWGGGNINSWTDISGFQGSSSSSGHLL
ncbi:hypothetical protein V2J09_001292 [Rumex salicifolius]